MSFRELQVEFTPHQYGWLERRYAFTQIGGDDSITSSTAPASAAAHGPTGS